ncbi:MAG: ABC transporter substrate-binding protein [Polyangiaceae bacterium]|nr:ABC transporter substrate-binding protein [Polyangiaceae bacterium]
MRRTNRFQGPFAVLAAMAALALGSGASSCNLVVDTDVAQCETTADCAAKGPEFADAVCSEKVCVLGDCTTNAECSARFGGEPAICRRPGRICVQLTTPECTEVVPAEALAEDQTVVLGFIGPLSGTDVQSGKPPWEGVKLALNELEQTAVGLPVKGTTQRRRLAVLACDDSTDPNVVAKHLAENVRAPLIIGPAFSSVTLEIATKITIPAGSLLMSYSATSPAITDLADNGLVWRIPPSDALQAIPMAKLVSEFETQIRADQSIPGTTPIKVAMTVLGDAYGTGLANAASGLIQFNGKGANDNGNNFLRVDYKPDTKDFKPTVSTVLAQAPQIVVLVGTTEAVESIFAGLKADPNANKRIYLFSDGGKIEQLLTSAGALRPNVFGTAPGRETPQYQAFQSRFKAQNQNKVPGSYAEHAYDATYLAAYALVATSEQTASGIAMIDGLSRSVGGAKIVAGPSQVNTAFAALLEPGGKINYDGVSGPLDFDVKKGEAPADIDVWCITSAGAFTSSGQFFNSVTNKVEGARTKCN